MVVLLHGAAGGWDELAIAVAAFVVLWVAVKLAGRKPASDDDDEEIEPATEDVRASLEPQEQTNPAQSPKLG
jgi:hypothetical protein